MNRLAEVSYYLLDRLDDLCYEIDEWKRESSTLRKYVTMVVFCFILGFIFLGCSLPQGTRKVTAWGIGFVPTPTGVPLPFAGYWHSEHGDDVVSEKSAEPKFPTYDF
jgi:hypothetical protein